jgi:bifunctional enzyme CysN/CysC
MLASAVASRYAARARLPGILAYSSRDLGTAATPGESMTELVTRDVAVMEEGAELLRFSTCGSVDDGKSTLIGRLLYDTKSIFEDQLAHVEDVSRRRGDEYTNLALLTDGLRAEREQGITIDVAYRYFATPRRKFIIADTPGHIQYTRNMVTGASTANLAIVLVDARQGLVEQSRRHSFIASLLRIPHLVLAVNKMDLVGWDEAVFRRIEQEFRSFASKLDVQDITFIPMSALLGDNVVDRSANMPWYKGSSLLHHLENVHIASDRNLVDVRFPVQWVVRPQSQSQEHHDYRGYAGQLAGGVMKAGDEVVVLPSGFGSKIARIETFDGDVAEAFPPMSVTVHLADDLDVSRGDMLCRPNNRPFVGQELEAMVCWMGEQPLQVRGRYALKHTTKWAKAMVTGLSYRLDINTLHREEGVPQLNLNDIGRVSLRVSAPLAYDEYRRNRSTGSFILVDESTNNTVGAGMLLSEPR